MVSNPVWEICERMAEVQALLHDHLTGGKHTAADVVARAQAVLPGTGHSQIQNRPLDPFLFRSTFHCHAFT